MLYTTVVAVIIEVFLSLYGCLYITGSGGMAAMLELRLFRRDMQSFARSGDALSD